VSAELAGAAAEQVADDAVLLSPEDEGAHVVAENVGQVESHRWMRHEVSVLGPAQAAAVVAWLA
jgi:hypothetical protein